MGRRLTVTDAPYPGAEDVADPYGFRHMTDGEFRESLLAALSEMQDTEADEGYSDG